MAGGGEIDIKNTAAAVTIKMTVLLHIGAVPGGGTLQVYLADEVAFDQRIQAIVDRGHGNIRHPLFGAEKYVLDRGMIPLLEQNVVHVLPLRREPKAAGRKPFIQAVIHFDMVMRTH